MNKNGYPAGMRVRLAMRFSLGVLVVGFAIPALAAADGLPQLDPTNGNNGTTYSITLQGVTRSMDPLLLDGNFTWKGTMMVLQNAGSGSFDADMSLDTNNDGILDRDLGCTGFVGKGRIAFRCSDTDGNGVLRLLVTGKAVTLDSGKISLRRAGGRGYTSTHTLVYAFQGLEQ